MTNLAVSMLRFSAALTLFSVEQLEKSLNVVEGGADLTKTMAGFENTLDSLSDVLMREMDDKKRETLQSVSKASKDMVDRTMDGMEIMDPREVIKASSDLLQRTADVTAKYVGKAAETMEKATKGAKPSAEAQPAAAE